MIPGATLALAWGAVLGWLALVYLSTLQRRLTDLIERTSHVTHS